MVALNNCQEVITAMFPPISSLDAEKIAEAVLLYVFRIALTAPLF